MSETYSPVRAVKTNYICDRCSEGNMVSTNVSNLTHTPQFLHRCDVCKWTASFTKIYPHIEYLPEANQ